MQKPIIGIVGRVNLSSKPFLFLYDEYRVAILKSGGIPFLILPPYFHPISNYNPFSDDMTIKEKSNIDAILNLCDGFLFPGGSSWYGYDQYIFQYALNHDKPVLGICLGMQLMANHSHFKEKNSDKTLKIHSSLNHQSNDLFVHSIKVYPSKLKNILKTDFLFVNSRHSSCILKDDYFLISSKSLDGIIESIEIPSQTFMIGVQWHPESLFLNDSNAKKLFFAFINACK